MANGPRTPQRLPPLGGGVVSSFRLGGFSEKLSPDMACLVFGGYQDTPCLGWLKRDTNRKATKLPCLSPTRILLPTGLLHVAWIFESELVQTVGRQP